MISLFLVLNSTITWKHEVKSSLCSSPCHDEQLTLSTTYTNYSIHWVQHTQSTAYTEYSIHRVQHTPSTAYTEYSIHRVQHIPSTSYTECCKHCIPHHPRIHCLPLLASLWCHGRQCCIQFTTFQKLQVNQWTESQLPLHLPSELLPPDRPPPSTSPISLDHGLQVYLQTCSITAPECICNPAWLRPPSASSNLHNHGLQVFLWTCTIIASKCISKLAPSWPPSASLDSLDYSLWVYLQAHTIMFSKLTQWAPPTASPNSLDHSFQEYLQCRSMTAFKLAELLPWSASLSSLDYGGVKLWSLKPDSQLWKLHCTSHGIRREFIRKCCSSSNCIGRGWDDINGYPAITNHTNCVNLWTLCKSGWGSTHLCGSSKARQKCIRP